MFFVLLTLIIQASGCKKSNKNDFPNAANFYYTAEKIEYHNNNGFISSEKRDVNKSINDLAALIDLYLQGPEESELLSPFPKNTVVHDITHKNGIFSIILSNEFAQLNGYDLSVACACLTLTIQQFVGANLIQISGKDADLDGNKHITMNTDSLVLYDQVLTEN